MSNNREKRVYQDTVHLYLALQRTGGSKNKKCLRHVIKNDELDLQMLEAKCKVIGGEWRIHRTVNARDCEKARKVLLKFLIDNPDHASTIDSEWRTALLQRECKAERNFMLDVDTKSEEVLNQIIAIIEKQPTDILYQVVESPKGRHIITQQFDTREICKIPDVTLLRDGYVFIKEIKC